MFQLATHHEHGSQLPNGLLDVHFDRAGRRLDLGIELTHSRKLMQLDKLSGQYIGKGIGFPAALAALQTRRFGPLNLLTLPRATPRTSCGMRASGSFCSS